MKTKTLFLLSLMIATSFRVFAGTEGGGGGDAVILPDGEIVLADVFLDRRQPQPDNMPRRISLNPKLLLQIGVYRDFFEQQVRMSKLFENLDKKTVSTVLGAQSKTEIGKLIDTLSKRESGLVFYSVKNVEELNTYCASGGTKAYILPNGAKVTQAACTSGDEVFLVEPIFRRMNLLQQSLLLFHERMTTLRDQYGGKNYGAIADVTSGLGEILKQAYLQQNGKSERLKDQEISRIRHFYEGLLEIEYRNMDIPTHSLDWNIHPNGGGMLKKGSEVAATSFVGVTSVVEKNVIIAEGSEIRGSILSGEIDLEREVKVIDSTLIGKIKIAEGSEVFNSSLLSDVKLGRGSRIQKTFIYGSKLDFGENARIKKSKILSSHLKVGANFSAVDSEIQMNQILTFQPIVFNDDQSIENGVLNNYSKEQFAPKGFKVVYPSISIPRQKTECQKPFSDYSRSGRDFKESTCQNVFSADVKVFDAPLVSKGIVLKLDQEIEYEFVKGPRNANRYYSFLRSFSMNLSFAPYPALAHPDGKTWYSTHEGVLAELGDSRIYQEIKFESNPYWYEYMQLIEKELKQVGAKTMLNGSTMFIQLMIGPKT